MLNHGFPAQHLNFNLSSYILPNALAERMIQINASTDTQQEYRLQDVYSVEIWKKLTSVGFGKSHWGNKHVLEISAGTGFLTYHILRNVKPASWTVNDISPYEVAECQKLVNSLNLSINVQVALGDATKLDMPSAKFDIIIGNSFLHHFYNVPQALEEFYRLLKPNGVFITLHEPTLAAVALEAGRVRAYLSYLRNPKQFDIAERTLGDEIVSVGGDIWIFSQNDLKQLLSDAGFSDVKLAPWHLYRSLKIAQNSLHLSQTKPLLSDKEVRLFNRSVYLDELLRTILPSRFFGSLCAIGYKQ